jgi:Short repeat of unknown function (DUF308)
VETATEAEARAVAKEVSRYWWLWLVCGIGWTIIAVVILQFDQASINTVGVLVGLMFFAAALQQFAFAGLVDHGRWLLAIFGVLFSIAGVLALISPENTFAALADMLGFLFLLVGVFWILQAFGQREINEFWWLGLIAGLMMVVLAFWTGGQFFIEKQYVLLVFAGIWALMQGFTDIVRAFAVRKLRDV